MKVGIEPTCLIRCIPIRVCGLRGELVLGFGTPLHVQSATPPCGDIVSDLNHKFNLFAPAAPHRPPLCPAASAPPPPRLCGNDE